MPANPKTIGLCISLFLASALITLAFRSVNPNTHWPSTHSHPGASTQKPLLSHRVAFATFLAGNANPDAATSDAASEKINDSDDGYFVGARVLAYQLLHSKSAGTNSSIPFLVICTLDVSKRKRDRLRADGATVILIEKLDPAWVSAASPRWRDVMSKLRLFQLVEYSKICFIDADTLVTAPLDGVFFDESTLTQATLPNPAGIKDDEAALPRTYMFSTHADYWGYDHAYPPPTNMDYLNCGFFVFTPSLVLFNYYISLLKLPGRFDPGFPEQNLLNYAHRKDGNMPWRPLWYGWNVNWPSEKDWKGGARSFHAKYWDGDPSHDPTLKAIWREQRAEMEGFWRGRELGM
jgi:alpha-N-acetylglucosamine transferase